MCRRHFSVRRRPFAGSPALIIIDFPGHVCVCVCVFSAVVQVGNGWAFSLLPTIRKLAHTTYKLRYQFGVIGGGYCFIRLTICLRICSRFTQIDAAIVAVL